MNKVNLTGRLTADPELRYTESNKAYSRFTLAVGRNFKNANGEYDADFFNIVAWEGKAETICKNVKKGNRFGLSGRLQNSKYQKQDGTTGYITDVVLEEIDFLESKPKEEYPAPEYPEEQSYDSDDPFAEFGDNIEITDNESPFL